MSKIAQVALEQATAAATALATDAVVDPATTPVSSPSANGQTATPPASTADPSTDPSAADSTPTTEPDLDDLAGRYGVELVKRALKNPEALNTLYAEIRKNPDAAGPWGNDIRQARADAAAKARQQMVAEQERQRAEQYERQRLEQMDGDDVKAWLLGNRDAEQTRKQLESAGEIRAHQRWMARLQAGVPEDVQNRLWEEHSWKSEPDNPYAGEEAWAAAIQDYKLSHHVRESDSTYRQQLETLQASEPERIKTAVAKALADQRQELEARYGTLARQAEPALAVHNGTPVGIGATDDDAFILAYGNGDLRDPADSLRAQAILAGRGMRL